MDLLACVLELLAPTRCAGCDLPGAILCDACRDVLPRIERAGACPRCGAPYGHLVCTECWQSEPAFSATVCVGSLVPPLARCVTLYKDSGERRLGPVLGALLAGTAAEWAGWPDAVVPVPASAASLRRRGFDHTRLVAEEVARAFGVPVLDALAVSGARDQRLLGRAERARNVADVFALVSGVRAPAHVLLVDDVVTTGATVDSAAGTLLAAGADEVRVGAVARAW